MTLLTSYDESGELLDGAFFKLEVYFEPEWMFAGEELRAGTIVTRIEGGFNVAKHLYAEVLFDEKRATACRLNPDHSKVVGRVNHRADLFGGVAAPDFVQDNFSQTLVVNNRLRRELGRSRLTGFTVVPLAVAENQSKCKTPGLFRVSLESSACVREMTVHVPEPNLCPFCGWGPIVCPECNHYRGYCRDCKQGLLVLEEEHGGPTDKRFTTTGVPRLGLILDGDRWDGSDFIPGDQAFLTRRAVQWFLEVGAAPFVAFPCRVDISRMTTTQKRRLGELV